jgi:hypothetical protein
MDHLAATPVAPVIAAADPEARKKIGASVAERLQCYATMGVFGCRPHHGRRHAPRGPAYENLQGRKPRERSRQSCRALELWGLHVDLERVHNLDVTARILLNGESNFRPTCDFKELGVAKCATA